MRSYIHRLIALICALLLGTASGCGGSQTTTPPPPSLGKLYVTNGLTATALRFPAGATGNVSPETKATFSGQPSFLALDVPHDRLAVRVGTVSQSIVLIDNASTTLSPARTISGPATTLDSPGYLALDSATDLLYIFNQDSTGGMHILVFGPATSISGNVAPLRTINLPTGTFGNKIPSFALDGANNRLFVANQAANAIHVFDNASTLNGAVTPDRVISGPATQLDQPTQIVLDNTGRLIVVSNPFPGTILVFANAGSANGNVAPVASTPIFIIPHQIAVSPTGDLYVVDIDSRISVYSNVTAPTLVRVITGPNTLLNPPPSPQLIPAEVLGVALDPTRN